MIQGGDPFQEDPAKEAATAQASPGYKIKAEFNDQPRPRRHFDGARAQPDSGSSQFFICLGAVRRLDHQYTTYTQFGKLIERRGGNGRESGDTPVVMAHGEMSKPTQRIVIGVKSFQPIQ